MEIGPLPKASKEWMRVGEELQPVGTCAGIIPYLGTTEGVDVLQEPDFSNSGWT